MEIHFNKDFVRDRCAHREYEFQIDSSRSKGYRLPIVFRITARTFIYSNWILIRVSINATHVDSTSCAITGTGSSNAQATSSRRKKVPGCWFVDSRVQSMSCSAFQERPKICITDFRHELMSIGSLQRGRKLVIVSNFRDQVAIWKYFGADSTYISLVSLPISRDGWDWKRCIVFSPSVLFSSFLSFCWLVRFSSKYSTNFDR